MGKKQKFSTKPPSGMRDFLPADIARRDHVIGVVRRVYERYGFVPLETPTIENLSTLLGKYGDEGDQLLYRILHRRDSLARALEKDPVTEAELADQGLRYDLTVPLARVVANTPYNLPKFFKRYQIQPVWRADRPGRGRFREFYQCDVDITGTTSVIAEAEVCGAVAEVLSELGFADFTIRINHREVLRAMIRAAGIDPDLEGTSLVAIDKLDKIGQDGVKAELAERGIDDAAATKLLAMVVADAGENDPGSGLAALREHLDARGQAAIDELAALLEILKKTPAGAYACFAPDLARGLSYYTGAIFEIAV
ncbi:MAG: ATP phosphoribosyltransferase regulatory subunit, partial [Myxococcales bacterium]|nr:ATP phosphoribosyltransferase regulatory subunit [Myxococcales bacterium]